MVLGRLTMHPCMRTGRKTKTQERAGEQYVYTERECLGAGESLRDPYSSIYTDSCTTQDRVSYSEI